MPIHPRISGAPVIALSIIDSSEDSPFSLDDRILLAVRNPETNPTHPNVVSVPTQRIPELILENLLQSSEPAEKTPSAFFCPLEPISGEKNSHDPVVFLVESLFSRKLGVADHLETGRMRFSVILFSMTLGTAHYKGNTPYGNQEEMAMGNLWVRIHAGFDLFPEKTASYSRIFSSDLRTLREVKATGDLSRFPSELALKAESIGGVCIASTINAIDFLERTNRVG